MRLSYLLPLIGVLIGAAPAAAQHPGSSELPKNVVTASVGGIFEPGSVDHGPEKWVFGPALSGGAGIFRRFGPALELGVESWLAPSVAYEVIPDGAGEPETTGTGRLVSSLISVRLGRGGGGGTEYYVAGGAGIFAYSLPELDRFDVDFSVQTGAALAYGLVEGRGLFFEWGRLWVFHRQEGSSRPRLVRHQQFRIGVKQAW